MINETTLKNETPNETPNAKQKQGLNKKWFIIPGLCTLILLAIFYFGTKGTISVPGVTSNSTLTIGELTYSLEVVKSERGITKGLSGRTELAPNEGMLFVFEQSDLHGIWMKDMSFKIDIVWLNAKQEVVHIEQYIKPETYPEYTFKPSSPAKYVIELPAGTVQKHKVLPKQTLNFEI